MTLMIAQEMEQDVFMVIGQKKKKHRLFKKLHFSQKYNIM